MSERTEPGLRWARRALPVVVIAVAWLAGDAGWAAQPKRSSASPSSTKQVVVAGRRYEAGKLRRVLLGSGYRKLWTIPIEVEVLDLDNFSGGLVAKKKGGGKQTKGLTFKGADGREWKFRSIDKDPSAVLPKGLRDTFADGIVQDQISASLPAGSLVVDALADAAGILQVGRRLVVLPSSPRLGEFREEFTGMLGTLEERPRVEPPVTPRFERYAKLVDTDELDEVLDADAAERVDARAFLRARLFDAWIGDYDRHDDQWQWARETGTGKWTPVPRDRDLAFVKFEGLLLGLARRSQPRLVNFEAEYPGAVGLMWQARLLDRRYLTELDWATWQEVIGELEDSLSDGVIDEAIRRLPPPYQVEAAPMLSTNLRSRREKLPAFARGFYELLAEQAEIHGTDEADAATISHLADGSAEVLISGAEGPYFRRTFKASETKEVRILLKGGDDRAVSEGHGKPGVKVRVAGGDGDDLLDDSGAGHARLYDSSGENRIVKGPGTKFSDRPYSPPLDQNGNPKRDWGEDSQVQPWLGAGGDRGLLIGAAFSRTAYGFRKHPYDHRHTLRAGYATGLGIGGIEYEYQSLRTDNRSRFHVDASASGLDTIHYYGFGNETTDTEPSTFYHVKQMRYTLAPAYRLELTGVDVSIGPVVQYSNANPPAASLIAQQRPYGFDRFGQAGARLSIDFDRRDDAAVASKGVRLSAEGAFYPALWDVRERFGVAGGEASVFATPPVRFAPTLALRVGGRKAFGSYPFHEAAAIGGFENLRGLRRQRYLGDGAVYGNAELRFALRNGDGGFFSKVGVFALTDVGRVFLKGEDSGRWHTSVGGGLWLSLFKATDVASFTVATSEGRVRLYLQGGLMF